MSAPLKVLVVDDDPDTLLFLATFLEDHGCVVAKAADGLLGLELLRTEQPGLVVMDVKMPNCTGVQMYREICDSKELAGVPVVFITGVSGLQIFGRDCSNLPKPAAILDKPIDLGLLRDVLGKVSKSKAGRRP